MDELTMTVSAVCTHKGEKVAYVTFSDEKRSAEGVIPECRIIKHSGFTDEEVGQLEMYLKLNLGDMKKRAAGVNPIRAMMEE